MADIYTLPGDPRLAQRIRQAAGRDALPHAVILSGHGDLPAAARFLAAAMECREASRPCGRCPACQKVRRDIHPDVITVQDPEHKNIAMDVLRQVRSDAYILPNEGRRKIYLFPDCALLDPKAQNVLLEVLEEGPPHAAFIFCGENSAVLLPTIRSRAVEWKLAPPEETASQDDGAKTLCQLLSAGRIPELAAFFTGLETGKTGREELQQLLSDARDLLTAALAATYGAGSPDPFSGLLAREMGRTRIVRALEVLGRYIPQCGYNIGVGHLAGALAVELAERGCR